MEAWRQQITDYQYQTFHPYNDRSRNNDEIRITIKNQEAYTVPQDSRICVRGQCKSRRNAGVDAAAAVTQFEAVNNYVAHLFERMRYVVNNVEVDSMKAVGITSTVKTYLTNTAAETVGLATAGWSSWSYNEADATFRAVVPLSMISGFASDFNSVMIRVQQDLVLVRSRTDKNALRCTTAANADNDAVYVDLTSIEWEVPVVKFNIEYESKILTRVKRNDVEYFRFRSWDTHEYPTLPKAKRMVWTLTTSTAQVPKFVVLVFQTNRLDNHKRDSSYFDNVDLTSFKVTLNGHTLPQNDTIEDFAKDSYLTFYRNYVDFMADYWRGEKLSEPALSLAAFKDRAIFVIKCVYEEVIKSGPMDISLIMESSKDFPDDTAAYAILINEVRYSYQLLNGLVKKIE